MDGSIQEEEMKMLVVFLLALIVLSACSKPAAERPPDFSLVFEWDTGALPPQYHYAYVIRIEPDGTGELVYSPGYEPLTQPGAWRAAFTLSPDQMDHLFALLRGGNMLRSDWQTGQPLVGGQGTRISITADGNTYVVPSVSVLSQSERETVEKVMEGIRSFVPAGIWEEMEARQSQFEADFEY